MGEALIELNAIGLHWGKETLNKHNHQDHENKQKPVWEQIKPKNIEAVHNEKMRSKIKRRA